jgi:hypothetical protein
MLSVVMLVLEDGYARRSAVGVDTAGRRCADHAREALVESKCSSPPMSLMFRTWGRYQPYDGRTPSDFGVQSSFSGGTSGRTA